MNATEMKAVTLVGRQPGKHVCTLDWGTEKELWKQSRGIHLCSVLFCFVLPFTSFCLVLVWYLILLIICIKLSPYQCTLLWSDDFNIYSLCLPAYFSIFPVDCFSSSQPPTCLPCIHHWLVADLKPVQLVSKRIQCPEGEPVGWTRRQLAGEEW